MVRVPVVPTKLILQTDQISVSSGAWLEIQAAQKQLCSKYPDLLLSDIQIVPSICGYVAVRFGRSIPNPKYEEQMNSYKSALEKYELEQGKLKNKNQVRRVAEKDRAYWKKLSQRDRIIIIDTMVDTAEITSLGQKL